MTLFDHLLVAVALFLCTLLTGTVVTALLDLFAA
jgi:hypothetical protein